MKPSSITISTRAVVFAGVLLSLLSFPLAGVDAQQIRFDVPEYPPFTGTVDGKPGGIAIEPVANVMKEVGLEMSVTVVANYTRCISDIQQGRSDGFFLASENKERDAVAVLSSKIMINNWLWAYPSSSSIDPAASDFKSKTRAGALNGSNPLTWLRDNGFNINGTPYTPLSLLEMLVSVR